MPKFTLEPPSIVIAPDEYLEACSPREIDTLIDTLNEDHHDELESCVRLSPENFLEKCNSTELEVAHNLLHDQYGIGADEDARSEGQRLFNYHLASLKENWLSVGKEDAEIIAVIAKKYGAI